MTVITFTLTAPPADRKPGAWDRRTRLLPPAQAAVQRAALFNTVSKGWVLLERDERRLVHWVTHSEEDGTAVLCGAPIPEDRIGELVPVQLAEPTTRAGQRHDLPLGQYRCRACVSELVRARHALPWQIGDRVTSHECAMTMHGTIVAFFEDWDDVPHVNLTRFWLREPVWQVNRRTLEAPMPPDTGPLNWFRDARTLHPYEPPPARTRARPPERPGMPRLLMD